jgi:hypothetical protein
MTPELQDRQLTLFSQHQGQNFKQTDRLFCYVLVIQWLAGIAISVFISPKIWNLTHNVQLNIWLAIVLGGIVCGLPIFCALSFQGTTISRHSIAIAQALISALFIHLTGGRTGSHFQIFGSLALLSLYRDPRVLISATLVATVDHIIRGIYWPNSMFGTETSCVCQHYPVPCYSTK